MTLADLNGLYQFTFSMDPVPEGLYSNTVSFCVVSDGRLMGLAASGSRWIGVYRVQGDELIASVTVTAQDADADVRVIDEQGQLVRGPIHFADVALKMIQQGGRLMLDGRTVKGGVTYHVVGRRLRGLENG